MCDATKAVFRSNKEGEYSTGMIKRTIVNRDQDAILRFYKSLVRPHLKYHVPVGSPYFRQDIDNFGSIQRRTTKLLRKFGKLAYKFVMGNEAILPHGI